MASTATKFEGRRINRKTNWATQEVIEEIIKLAKEMAEPLVGGRGLAACAVGKALTWVKI